MESCRCDSSSALSDTMRQMEAEWHSLTSHSAGIRGRVKLGKSRMRHFQDTFKKLEAFERLEFLCYLKTIDRKMRERRKAVTFLSINEC